ncbi:hypothetical protein [Corynebacterium diphtheriae]|uniref:hypothetical protein n=1 Tax=Corynebacterium diphtheriae TaxID=1717 RepID=UPI000B4A89BD|nr:hypothetical protein [Corynebacterium diphtheriae]OWO24033.1 hypothetical protein AY535_08520 [Corynebacterium diphtheriae bv. gravis]
MYISTATMAAIFTLLTFLSGVVIWLVIIAGRLSEQVMTLFACYNVMDDDLAAVESDIQDIYDEMGIKRPTEELRILCDPDDDDLEVPDFLQEAA